MKVLQPQFKQFCIDKVGQECAEKIYSFYKSLSTKQQGKTDKFLNLSERRERSLTFLLENYGIDNILETIDIFNKKAESGELTVNTIPYFNKMVENHSIQKNKKPVPRTNPIFFKTITTTIIPVRKRSSEINTYEIDLFNWVYECSQCKAEFTGWDEHCPKCNLTIDWDHYNDKNSEK
jgi:hypothetical protein